MSSAILSDTVVERTPAAAAPSGVLATKWNDVVTRNIAESFQRAQRSLRGGRADAIAENMASALATAPTVDAARSIYHRATLMDKARIAKRFQLSHVSKNPVYAMLEDPDAQTDNVSISSVVKGISYDLLTEEELWNAQGKCLSMVRVYMFQETDARVGGAPTLHGLLDERMGPTRSVDSVTKAAVNCPVCAGRFDVDRYVEDKVGEPGMCPGHFGHMQLPGAIWSPMMVPLTINVLRSFCWLCGSLPGSDEKNARTVAKMFATCETRAEKVNFLAKTYAKMPCCQNCATTKNPNRRCRECRGEEQQCGNCANFLYFRPRLSTTKQVKNSKENVIAHHITEPDGEEGAAENVERNEMLRSVARSETSGFPCEALLNGNALDNPDAYEAFATETYGTERDQPALIMHGERVRLVFAQMSDDFLKLFFESALDSCDDVRAWFNALVPRIIPVIPNCARPTVVGTNGRLVIDDLTRRYKDVIRISQVISKRIDPNKRNEDAEVFYNYGRPNDPYWSPRNQWFKFSDPDKLIFIEHYSELQYYCAAIVSDTRALSFRSSAALSHGVGRGAAARAAHPTRRGADGEEKPVVMTSIEKRLFGKDGRVRGNQQGKRTGNSIRTVITPDPTLSIREVRVPAVAAARVVVPELLNSHNAFDVLTRAERSRTMDVDQKPHRGCTGCARCERIAYTEHTELCIFNADKTDRVYITGPHRLKTPVFDHPFVLEPGCVVERTLRTGDYIVMNRQPSLHQHSTQAHRAIVDWFTKTFGFPTLNTKAYNADFDGDEMNGYIASAMAARVEVELLLTVAEQSISSSNSQPVREIKQDAATGVYKLTSKNTFLDKGLTCDILFNMNHDFYGDDEPISQLSDASRRYTGDWNTPYGMRVANAALPEPAIRYKKDGRWHELWTGLQIASMMLPQTDGGMTFKRPFDYELSSETLDYPAGGVKNDTEMPIFIQRSEFLFGRIDKSAAKAIDRALLTRITPDQSRAHNEACTWIDRCGFAGRTWLDADGFSIGLGDCIIPTEAARKVAQTAMSVGVEVRKMLRENKELLQDPQMDRVSVIEREIKIIEKRGTDVAHNTVNAAAPPNNAFVVMRVSGAKGGPENLGQIAGVVGSQQVEGRRVIDEYIGPRPVGGADVGLFNNQLIEVTSGSATDAPSKQILSPSPTSRALDFLGKRIWPHTASSMYPDSESGGYVANCFLTGLTPREFWCHAASGRIGIIDTAVKTSVTGDAQRLASKSSEGIVIRTDATVRNETDQIVSFRYGGTSYHPTALMVKSLPFIGMADLALRRALFFDNNDWALSAQYSNQADIYAVQQEQIGVKRLITELRTRSNGAVSGTEITTPNNLRQIIVDVLTRRGDDVLGAMWRKADDTRITWFEQSPTYGVDNRVATPAEAVEIVDGYVRRWTTGVQAICDRETEAEVRLVLSAKQVTRRLRLRPEALRAVLDTFQTALYRAIAPPGEAVGEQMIQSIGQPSTQMTLNTFHHTGTTNIGVISGVPRQNELSLAVKTVRMKGVKVILPLRMQLLYSTGQRSLAARILSELTPPRSRSLLPSQHVAMIREKMVAPMRTIALERFREVQKTATMQIAAASASRPSVTQQIEHSRLIAGVLADIDRFFVSEDVDTSVEDDCTIVAPMRTLHSMTRNWRTLEIAKNAKALRAFTHGELFQRAHTTLLATIRPAQRACTTVAMLCESLWRAMLPIFGADTPFAVVPHTQPIETNDDNDDDDDGESATAANAAPTVDQRRRAAAITEVATEVAIVAIDQTSENEKLLYEHVRQNRHQIFVDLLEPSDSGTVTQYSTAVMRDNLYHKPNLYVVDIAGTDAAKERDNKIFERKQKEIITAQTRHLYKNIVSTRISNITLTVTAAYEPITYDAVNDKLVFAFANPEEDGVTSDRYTVGTFEQDMCSELCDNFHGFQSDTRCQNEDCLAARADPTDPRHDEAMVGCLSNWALSFRLDSGWFVRNQVAAATVQECVASALGPFFCVMMGGGNSYPYVPMRIHVYRCCVEKACALFNNSAIAKVNDMPEDDPCLTALNRAMWPVLNLAFSGPSTGSVVMSDKQFEQQFTSEKGLENVSRPVLTSNGTDLYHLMGLRGIDARHVRTNSPHDALRVIGVEAARATLIREYNEVIKAGGQFINKTHLALRADIQTRNGRYLPLSAAGLRSAPHDVYQSASHRETAMMFVQGALNRRKFAGITSPSTSVAVARPLTHIGTGGVVLLPDLALFAKPDVRVAEPLPLEAVIEMHKANVLRVEDEELQYVTQPTRRSLVDEQRDFALAQRHRPHVPQPVPQSPVAHFASEMALDDNDDGDDSATGHFSPVREGTPPPVPALSSLNALLDEVDVCEPYVFSEYDDGSNMPTSPQRTNYDTPKSSPVDETHNNLRALADMSWREPTPFDEPDNTFASTKHRIARVREESRRAAAAGVPIPAYDPEAPRALSGVSSAQLAELARTVTHYTAQEYDPDAESVIAAARTIGTSSTVGADEQADSDDFNMCFNATSTSVRMF